MTYEEAREQVTSFTYLPCKREGGPCHPDFYGIGCNPQDSTTEWYERQLNAYIKDIYGVSPAQGVLEQK